MCDYIYRLYKCFWDEVRLVEASQVNSIRFSLYDALGFSRLYDEEEVFADEKSLVEPEVAPKLEVDTTADKA